MSHTYYSKVLKDRILAQDILKQTKLCQGVAGQLLFDIFCISSLNHQMFYLQFYRSHVYTLVYARACVFDDRKKQCLTMCSFQDALEASYHPGYRGKIICSMKQLPLDDPIIGMLLECLPLKNEYANKDGIIIDGSTVVIENYQKRPSILLVYRSSDQIVCNPMDFKHKEFLDHLSDNIERIIGNFLDYRDYQLNI